MNKDDHDFIKVADYVKLMLGAPVIKLDLTDDDIDQCVDAAAKEITKRLTKYGKNVSAKYMELKLQEGALARAKYLIGKFKFANSLRDGNFWKGPETDGWDMMCEGSGEWDDFKETLTDGQ
jgi:hypothetical protein